MIDLLHRYNNVRYNIIRMDENDELYSTYHIIIRKYRFKCTGIYLVLNASLRNKQTNLKRIFYFEFISGFFSFTQSNRF